MAVSESKNCNLTFKEIITLWWPLAASWLLMAFEMPAVTAIVARLKDPEIHLAAYGGIVSPISLVIESPIIMFLSASTALCIDKKAFDKVYSYMMAASLFLTILHFLTAFTPLYDWTVFTLLEPPKEIIPPARYGLMIMTPWTWAIAYRRFHQGVLIRFGHSKPIGVGTIVRLITLISVLLIGFVIKSIPGVIVGASALTAGVVAEAIYVRIKTIPVIRYEIPSVIKNGNPITIKSFLNFYVPLALTSLMTFMVHPIGSAALSRMPYALHSLAVLPVVNGILFIFRSPGNAFNEVVISLLDKPAARKKLLQFSWILAGITSTLLIAMTMTGLIKMWCQFGYSLDPILTSLANQALALGLIIPGLTVFQSWLQGNILFIKKTRIISEALLFSLVSIVVILLAGVIYNKITGVFFSITALSVGAIIQTTWLWYRSKGLI